MTKQDERVVLTAEQYTAMVQVLELVTDDQGDLTDAAQKAIALLRGGK